MGSGNKQYIILQYKNHVTPQNKYFFRTWQVLSLVKTFLNFHEAQRSIMVWTRAQQHHSGYTPKVALSSKDTFINVYGWCYEWQKTVNLRKNKGILKTDELRKDAGILKDVRMNKG